MKCTRTQLSVDIQSFYLPHLVEDCVVTQTDPSHNFTETRLLVNTINAPFVGSMTLKCVDTNKL